MSLERTKVTEGFKLYPEGRHIFTLTEVEKRRSQKGKIFFIFKFSFEENGTRRKYSESFMEFLCEPILKGLRVPYDPDEREYVWDTIAVTGRQIEADIAVVPQYKEKDKKRNQLKNITPFPPGDDALEAPPAEEEEAIPF